MRISPELKQDIENLFNSSDSSESLENLEGIVQNSEKLYLKSALINNLPVFNSDGNNSEEIETFSIINEDQSKFNKDTSIDKTVQNIKDTINDKSIKLNEDKTSEIDELGGSVFHNTLELLVESSSSTSMEEDIQQVSSSSADNIRETNVITGDPSSKQTSNDSLSTNNTQGGIDEEVHNIKSLNKNREEEFINFLNKFEVENSKFVPIQYENVYRHYGTKIGSKTYLDEWEVLHIFNSSSVEEALKNLNILRIRSLTTEPENTTTLKHESNIKEISRSHEKLFYKAYFSLKEKYNIFDARVHLRNKDFNRKKSRGIPIHFVDFKTPEFIKQEGVVYVVLNETDFVCFSVENILPDLETPERLIKKD